MKKKGLLFCVNCITRISKLNNKRHWFNNIIIQILYYKKIIIINKKFILQI